MKNTNDYRRGRTVVSALHAHLVFVAQIPAQSIPGLALPGNARDLCPRV
jgi:hypothetical protein